MRWSLAHQISFLRSVRHLGNNGRHRRWTRLLPHRHGRDDRRPQGLAGPTLRTVLAKAAATSLSGTVWRAFVTLLVQSSSATTMTTIGLVSARSGPRPSGQSLQYLFGGGRRGDMAFNHICLGTVGGIGEHAVALRLASALSPAAFCQLGGFHARGRPTCRWLASCAARPRRRMTRP